MFDSHLPYVQLTVHYEIDPSFHIRTFVYRIKTTAGAYIINVEEYVGNMFVLKFYPARFKRHNNKYQLISHDNVMQTVIGTALKIFLEILSNNIEASFGFVATASVIGPFTEEQENNQRFRIYKQIMKNFFGHNTFVHFADGINSAYLMVNRKNLVTEFVHKVQERFRELYPGIFNLQFAEI